MAKENPLYEIVGAFEEDQAAKAIAEQQGVVCNYPSFEELLADPMVEAVALGGCYADRGGMAIAALKAGKHVIADKPLCTSLEELDTIEALASEKGLQVSCMLTMRYEKKIRGLKALFESGALGEINNVYFGGQHPLQYGRRPMWYFEKGKHGGTLNDIAIHGIDALAYALNLHTDKILAARTWNKLATEQPDFKECGQIMLTAKNGAGILADVSYTIPDGVEFALPYYWQFYIWGTKGVIRFSLNDEKAWYYLAGDKEPHLLEEPEIDADYLTDFYNLLRGEKTALTMAEVFASTRATLTIQQAAN
jgi:predicted dehydrogenase